MQPTLNTLQIKDQGYSQLWPIPHQPEIQFKLVVTESANQIEPKAYTEIVTVSRSRSQRP